MSDLRTTLPLHFQNPIDISPKFSNFDFIETYLDDTPPIHRLFSQARLCGAKTLIMEEIKSVGLSKEDDMDLEEAGFMLSSDSLKRISFFNVFIQKIEELANLNDSNFSGYAILKKVPAQGGFKYIVFESVFRTPKKYPNNYIHRTRNYKVNIRNRVFTIQGVLYCQQNGLTNVCAHASLRTCISMLNETGDFSYHDINRILKDANNQFKRARANKNGTFSSASTNGLSSIQIQQVLKTLGINFRKFDPPKKWYNKWFFRSNPVSFQAYLYSSIESGYPAMLGFSLGDRHSSHVISVIGHTFNRDTLVPNAEKSYFNVGKDTRYVPSESWVSTYICHDDNFGSYYCLPRQYIPSDSVLVISLLPPVRFDAIEAEAIASDYLIDLTQKMLEDKDDKIWAKRLINNVLNQRGWVVLRTQFLTSQEYTKHLESLKGWDEKTIPVQLIKKLSESLPTELYMIEVSLPELFSANERKLGEIILDPNTPLTFKKDLSTLIFARLLNKIYGLSVKDEKTTELISIDIAEIDTHTQLFERDSSS